MDVSISVLMTLILHFLTSDPSRQTLILAKSLTSDAYNRGLLKRRKSVQYMLNLLFHLRGASTWCILAVPMTLLACHR